MAKLPSAFELMATAASPAINFGRGLLGYQDPFMTQTMQDRMKELEAGRTKGNIGYEDYGLQTATPGGRFTGGLMDLAISNPVDFGLAGSIGRYSFSPEGRTGLTYDFTPDIDTGSTGNAMLDFINAGGLKGAFSKMGTAQAAEVTPSNTGIMSTPYIDRIMDPGSMRAAAYRSIENEPYQEIPGFNFIDAPTSLKSRIQNPEFLNNPRTGIIDNLIMQKGNPGNTIVDKVKSGFGKSVDLGKAALSGILSLATGVPFLGNALTGIASQFENRPLEAGVIDESGNFYDPEQLNKMNALGGYYTDPARSARRRSKRIARMLERQKLGKKISQKNLEKLQAQEKAQEAAQRKAMDAMFARGEGGSGQDFTGGRYDGAGSQAGYDANPTGFSGSS
jgi:hypothetical protein